MTVLLEDRAAAHQIVMSCASVGAGTPIAVSCTCLRLPRAGRAGHRVIEARKRFPAAEAIAAWRAWHERKGIELP